MTKTRRCTASVWPHRHTDELTGPLDLKISYWNQPRFVQDWVKGRKVWVQIEQPDEQTNLTILKVAFNWPTGNKTWSRVRPCRLTQDKSLKFYLRGRITNQMEHPIPRGQWEGTYRYDDTWCVYTFQAMTAKVTKKKSIIILPGEDGF